jgi:hypothetical protein
MEVTFRRTGERRYAVVAEPEGHPAVTMDPAPGFDPRLPHDLVHYAVEREHGVELGVFGQLAAGGNLRTFRRLDGTPDRRLRRRGERLAREHLDELARSERLAAEALRAWVRGPEALRAWVRGPGPHGDERLERVCARLDGLSTRWSALAVGEAMTVTWPATRRTLHTASPARHRAAPRPRGQTPRRI